MSKRENFYILLELNTNPPERDLKVIEKKIRSKQALWSRMRNHPSKGRIAQLNLSMLKEIKETMLNEKNRLLEEKSLLNDIAQNQKELKKDLEKMIEMLEAKGSIFEAEIKNLHNNFPSFSLETIKKMVKVPIKTGKELNVKVDNINIDLESLDLLKIKKINQNLKLLKKRDLYDFLSVKISDSCEQIQNKVKNMYIENNKLASKGAMTTASSELLGLCVNIFRNKSEKKLYDNSLIKNNLKKLLPFLEIASVNKFIEAQEYLYIQEESKSLLIPDYIFKKYIDKYCEIKKCKLILPKPGESLNRKKTAHDYSKEIYTLVKKEETRELEKLLQRNKNINVNLENDRGDTPIIMAAYLANIKIIKLLLENGADVDKMGHNNMTALSWACTKDNIEILRILLSKTKDINHQDKYGFTPLMWAASNGFDNMVKLLLEYNAKIDIKNKENLTAAELARKSGFLKLFYTINDFSKKHLGNDEVFKRIENNDILFFNNISRNNMLLENKNKEYPLEYAIKLKKREIINKIISKRLVDLNKKTPTGYSYVIVAIQERDIVTLSKLYDKGADLNLIDDNGYSPLMHAVTSGDIDIVKYLLLKNIDLEYTDNLGNRATTLAVWQNKKAILELLVKFGAKLDIKNKKSKTLIDLAQERNNKEIIEFLKVKLNISDLYIEDKEINTIKNINQSTVKESKKEPTKESKKESVKENIKEFTKENKKDKSKTKDKKTKKKPWWKFW